MSSQSHQIDAYCTTRPPAGCPDANSNFTSRGPWPPQAAQPTTETNAHNRHQKVTADLNTTPRQLLLIAASDNTQHCMQLLKLRLCNCVLPCIMLKQATTIQFQWNRPALQSPSSFLASLALQNQKGRLRWQVNKVDAGSRTRKAMHKNKHTPTTTPAMYTLPAPCIPQELHAATHTGVRLVDCLSHTAVLHACPASRSAVGGRSCNHCCSKA